MDDVTYVEVKGGETFLVPSGWIHAVYTPEDSIAFGGNFLTGYHIQMQLRCHGIEDALHVGKQFRFPHFESVHWYAAAFYAKKLQVSKDTKKSTPKGTVSKWEMKELKTLASKLDKWLDLEKQASSQDDTPSDASVCKEISPARICKASGGFSSPQAMLATIRESLEPSSHLAEEKLSRAKVVGSRVQEPSSSPCPSTTSNTSSSVSSSSSSESSSSASDSSSSSPSDSDSENEPPEKEEEEEEEKEEEKAGDESGSESDSSSSSSSDSSSSSSSSNHTSVPVDEANENDGESSTSESEGSDLENAYPRLPSAPVDALLAIRKLAKLDEMKITSETKDEIIQRARKHQRERLEQLKRGKKKDSTKKMQSITKQILHDQDLTLYQASPSSTQKVQVSVDVVPPGGNMPAEEQEDWVVDCTCGMSGRNIDDGTKMVECDKCKNWVHIACALKPGRTEIAEHFLCFKCETWYFDCKCGMRGSDYDDGSAMIECDKCKVWQHTECAGFSEGVELPKHFRCDICRGSKPKRSPTTSNQKQRNRKQQQQPDQRRRNSASEKPSASAPAAPTTDVAPMPPSSPPPHTPASTPPPPPMPPSTPPPPSVAPPVPVNIPSNEQSKRKSKSDHRKRSRSSPLDSAKSTSSKKKFGTNREAASEPSEDGLLAKHVDLSVVARPPLPITPKSSTANGSAGWGSTSSTKRKSESARERLEKKLKKKKLR